jgi:hypothetical protein
MATAKKATKKPPKKRNILTESTKPIEPEAFETNDVTADEKPTVSKPIGKSRKTQSIEDKRKKDAEYQKNKRDTKREEKEVKTEQESVELQLAVETFACMPFDFLAKRDEKWKLTPEERKAFAGSATAMMDKYAGVLSGYAVETSFALCAVSILLPRVMFNGKESQQVVSDIGEKGNGQDTPHEGNDRVSNASNCV